jgi:hypothetical protein
MPQRSGSHSIGGHIIHVSIGKGRCPITLAKRQRTFDVDLTGLFVTITVSRGC